MMKFVDPLNKNKIDFQALFDISDPFEDNHITFSRFVLALASVKIQTPGKEGSLINLINDSIS